MASRTLISQQIDPHGPGRRTFIQVYGTIIFSNLTEQKSSMMLTSEEEPVSLGPEPSEKDHHTVGTRSRWISIPDVCWKNWSDAECLSYCVLDLSVLASGRLAILSFIIYSESFIICKAEPFITSATRPPDSVTKVELLVQ
ncbi:hypothetical protein AMECASPLE_034338 [Ameca splendens]|uniref:Uncharacterized protein n=1 Tax=Ameca splendens TaxID=208324 RepID=A0ABV0ZS10_9TELE